MTEKRPIEEIEVDRHLILKGEDIDPKKEVTEDEFNALLETHQFHGVNHEQRVAFLKRNQHEVTRENLINPLLSETPPPGK